MEDWQHGGFGLYLHWPFCQSKCPYCDFNSHVASHVNEARWLYAFQSEISRYGQLTSGRHLRSIYFGGGTPSLMSPDLVSGILQAVRATWALSNDCEVTLEANPGSIEVGRFQGYRDVGVNRISMGFQAMNDVDLRRLGRMHSVTEARQAFDIARHVFDRVSFDLIYARQDQSLEGWRSELRQALSLGVDHLSLYQLTVEDGTVFGERFAKGQLRGLPNEDLSVAMFETTQALCEAAGLPAYEVSNHARPGSESRHNLVYWRGGDYVGIGPGAHGRITLGSQRNATVSERLPGEWLQRVETTGNAEESRESLTGQEAAAEYLMMGLRVSDGISRDRFRKMGGDERREVLQDLCAQGLLFISEETVRTTATGRLLLNEVVRRLLA